MDYNYQAQMQKKLTQMLEEGLFQNRCITVFGSNEPAEQMIAFLKKQKQELFMVILIIMGKF